MRPAEPPVRPVLDALERSTGLRLWIAGALTGGEIGAFDLRDRDGRRFVLKHWRGDDDEGADLGRRLEAVETLRQAGYPAPVYLVSGSFAGHVVALQSWVDGTQRDDLSEAMVTRLTDLALRHGDVRLPASREFGTWVTRSLLEGCDGYCLHEPLRAHGGETRALLERIRGIGARTAGAFEPAAGVVHRDFHHRNALWQGDNLAAIVDWEGVGVGDPAFDLITLAFGLTVSAAPARAREAPWRTIERRRPPAVLLAYAAHMALRQVDWSIRHRGPAEVRHWLRVGCDALDRFGHGG